MTPRNPKWHEFVQRLEGPEGVRFRASQEQDVIWDCHHNFKYAAAVLARMGLSAHDIEESLQFFVREGAYCDCEILFNLAP